MQCNAMQPLHKGITWGSRTSQLELWRDLIKCHRQPCSMALRNGSSALTQRHFLILVLAIIKALHKKITWGSMEPSQPEVGTKVKKGKTRMEVPTERKREKAAGQMPVMIRLALGSDGGSASSRSKSPATGDDGHPSTLPTEFALSAPDHKLSKLDA